MTHSSSGQQVQAGLLGEGGQAGDEGGGNTSSFGQYFYLKCTDFVLRALCSAPWLPPLWRGGKGRC